MATMNEISYIYLILLVVFQHRLCLADPLVTKILSTNSNVYNNPNKDSNRKTIDNVSDSLSRKEEVSMISHDKEPMEGVSRKKKKRRIAFNNKSNNSNEDGNVNKDDNIKSDKAVSGDPTKSGRKKKYRKLNQSNDTDTKISSCATSCIQEKYDSKLEQAYSCTVQNQNAEVNNNREQKCCLICSEVKEPHKSSGFLALEALKRIITGKFDYDDKEGIDNFEKEGAEEIENSDNDSVISDIDCDELEKQNLKNPLIFRNIMIRRSGALPLLSRAMVESLEATMNLVRLMYRVDDGLNTCQRGCDNCIQYLCQRVECLSSILDAICCLSSENRSILCSATNYFEDFESPILIPTLLRMMVSIPINAINGDKGNVFQDVVLSSFRTLTSLTHENDIAGSQLVLNKYDVKSAGWTDCVNSICGIEVLSKILYSLSKVQQEVRLQSNCAGIDVTQKNVFDAIVFSLNIITNVLETSSSSRARDIAFHLLLQSKDCKQAFPLLSWLTQWVVSQTSTFQDVVSMNIFGDKKNNSDDLHDPKRDLERHEDEFLVQAGNGFILLACFLVGESGDDVNICDLDDKIRSEIMTAMPKDENGKSMGLNLIVNTLKAFCNYYRYSIGELSVAVVEPVLRLIRKLEMSNVNDWNKDK